MLYEPDAFRGEIADKDLTGATEPSQISPSNSPDTAKSSSAPAPAALPSSTAVNTIQLHLHLHHLHPQ